MVFDTNHKDKLCAMCLIRQTQIPYIVSFDWKALFNSMNILYIFESMTFPLSYFVMSAKMLYTDQSEGSYIYTKHQVYIDWTETKRQRFIEKGCSHFGIYHKCRKIENTDTRSIPHLLSKIHRKV